MSTTQTDDYTFIIDVSNYLHRYYHALSSYRAPINNQLVKTGHIVGFTNLIKSIKDIQRDSKIILALDGKHSSNSRKSVNSHYKETRNSEESKSIRSVIRGSIFDLLDILSPISDVKYIYDRDYEADDAIYSYVNSTNENICILSNDRDMYQLVSERVCVVRKFVPTKDWLKESTIIKTVDVQEAFNGVLPEDLLKFRAITGDKSDNLKGYYRFRKAEAAKIASTYDYIDGKLVKKNNKCLEDTRYLEVILNDFDLFCKNYDVMSLHNFSFELSPLPNSPKDVILTKIKQLQLFNYLRWLSDNQYI